MNALDYYESKYGTAQGGTATESTVGSLVEADYIPGWSYITIVEKTINTQTVLVRFNPMF